MRRISDLAIMVCLLALAGCAAPPLRTEAPTEAVPRSRNIDTSGTFAKGFNRDEALRLLELCLNLNNPDDGAAYAADTSAWEPIYPDAADKPADVLGPWQNAWKLWRSKTEAKTYAVVIRGTMEDETSIIEDVIATSVAQPTRMGRAERRSPSSARAQRRSGSPLTRQLRGATIGAISACPSLQFGDGSSHCSDVVDHGCRRTDYLYHRINFCLLAVERGRRLLHRGDGRLQRIDIGHCAQTDKPLFERVSVPERTAELLHEAHFPGNGCIVLRGLEVRDVCVELY
jgi:hypothetical protein